MAAPTVLASMTLGEAAQPPQAPHCDQVHVSGGGHAGWAGHAPHLSAPAPGSQGRPPHWPGTRTCTRHVSCHASRVITLTSRLASLRPPAPHVRLHGCHAHADHSQSTGQQPASHCAPAAWIHVQWDTCPHLGPQLVGLARALRAAVLRPHQHGPGPQLRARAARHWAAAVTSHT